MQVREQASPLAALKKYYGYSSFRPGQEIMVQTIISGRDALGIMPTGAGKSICYQIPALLLPGITLVVSPLISLMMDQVKALNAAGIHAAYINSSLTEAQITKALQYAAQGRYKIIYVAPERLESREFICFAQQAEISMVTVDEAHCISQWGQDFRPGYLKIVQFIRNLAVRPIVSAFTATATEEVKNDILCVLGLVDPKVLVTGFDRKNLYFGVETAKKDEYVRHYVKRHADESGIIYCATRKNVDKLCQKLEAEGIAATRYHAGLADWERRENQEDFIYDRKPVMVATNAFGMGIDKSNVRYVLHYNMPQSMENYYQEAGRAGRDGEPAECILLYSAQDVMINRYLLEQKQFEEGMLPEDMEAVRRRDAARLRAMTNYCTSTGCLRAYILRYFGEETEDTCGNCSACQSEYEECDRTEEAKQVLACVREARGRYGVNVIAGTLAGARRGKLQEYGCMEYQSYGALKHLGEAEIKKMIAWLVAEGDLRQTEDRYGLLRVELKAQGILSGEKPVILRVPKKQAQPVAAADAAPERRQKSASVDLNSRGFALFDALRALRMEIARRESVPPYVVFSDKTLVGMCTLVPFTREEMLEVSGVGENKFEKYGRQFLDAIREFTGGQREKLYYGDIVENEEPVRTARRREKKPFAISREQAAAFPYAEKYRAPEIAEALYALVDHETYKKTSGAEILRWIEAEGLAGEKYENGRRTKYLTAEGERKGILLETRISQKGTEYLDLYYNEQAQRMIVEHFLGRED